MLITCALLTLPSSLQALGAEGSGYSTEFWVQHRVLPLWGLVVFVFQGTCCCVVLLATGGCPTIKEEGGSIWGGPLLQ